MRAFDSFPVVFIEQNNTGERSVECRQTLIFHNKILSDKVTFFTQGDPYKQVW